MQAWVDKGLGYGKSYTLFYTDATMQQYYKDWLYKIVTRTNSITGVKYTDDPTIMAYELANEPRVGDNYERNNNLKPGQIVCDWVYLMSSYIKCVCFCCVMLERKERIMFFKVIFLLTFFFESHFSFFL